MYSYFCRHWGGWNPAEFKKSFITDNIKVIIISGKRAGFLSLKVFSESIYIENIQLSPKIHGKGIGTKILKQVFEDNQSKNIELTTFEDNPVKKLYERLGFEVSDKKGMTIKMERIA